MQDTFMLFPWAEDLKFVTISKLCQLYLLLKSVRYSGGNRRFRHPESDLRSIENPEPLFFGKSLSCCDTTRSEDEAKPEVMLSEISFKRLRCLSITSSVFRFVGNVNYQSVWRHQMLDSPEIFLFSTFVVAKEISTNRNIREQFDCPVKTWKCCQIL